MNNLGAKIVSEKTEKIQKHFHHDESNHPHVETGSVLKIFKSIFPLDFFPDELIVEENRVIWIKRMGPKMCKVLSFLPSEITKIKADVGPLLGHLHVDTFGTQQDILMKNLSRSNTLLARALIAGLVEASKRNIDLEGKTHNEKITQLVKLAHVSV